MQQSDAEQMLNALQKAALVQTNKHQVHTIIQYTPSIASTCQDMEQHAGSSSSNDNNNSNSSATYNHTELHERIIHEAVAFSDACADGKHQLLAAVSGPRDLLVPPAQQKIQPYCRRTRQQEVAVLHYLHHQPISALKTPARQPLQSSLTGLIATKQQMWQQSARHEACKPSHVQQQPRDDAQRDQSSDVRPQPLTAEHTRSSDVAALALAAPCPVEALLGHDVWWNWQQALLGLDTCDTCGADTHQVGGPWHTPWHTVSHNMSTHQHPQCED